MSDYHPQIDRRFMWACTMTANRNAKPNVFPFELQRYEEGLTRWVYVNAYKVNPHVSLGNGTYRVIDIRNGKIVAAYWQGSLYWRRENYQYRP